jgi:cytochrome c oxidase assembly protein subunit 15
MPTGAISAADARALRSFSRGFVALTGATFVLIVLGALVRAHGAGLACPDWPLCFGRVIPPFDLRVGFEWTHRLVAGGVALGFVALCFGVLRRPAARRICAPAVACAALLLVIQVALGALTVWHLLAAWTVTAHLVTGNAFAACLLAIALQLRHAASAPPPAPARSARPWVFAFGACLAFQLVLGGLVSSRYAGLACPEWPTCSGGVFFPSWQGAMGLHLLHRTNGYALGGVLLAAAIATRGAGRAGRVLRLAAGLGLAQVVVGVLNVRLALPVEVTGLHSALAAALVLSLAAAGFEAFAAAEEAVPRAGWSPARSEAASGARSDGEARAESPSRSGGARR